MYLWALCSSGNSHSNLDRFLQCVTPVVPSRTLPQSCLNDLNSLWQPLGKDTTEYFTLKDLWDCYNEWSAYGVGIPLMLESGETLMHYFVPYLSAIQIYSDKSVAVSRIQRDDGDGAECESDSWSDDSGSDNLSRSFSNSSKAWDAISVDSSCDQEGSWLTRVRLGDTYLQYNEMSSPYWRVPLVDKITELARTHPALMTLRSVDLSPASWIAVAWYPIYPIPSMKNEKDLATCFLTYHTLSSSFQDDETMCNDINTRCSEELGSVVAGEKSKKNKSGHISLPPFGLATYKFHGDVWLNPQSCDQERILDLHSAADSWLKQLNAHHHDYNFFTYHPSAL